MLMLERSHELDRLIIEFARGIGADRRAARDPDPLDVAR